MKELTVPCELLDISAVVGEEEYEASTSAGAGDSSLSPVERSGQQNEPTMRQLVLVDVDDEQLSTSPRRPPPPTVSSSREKVQELSDAGELPSMSMSMSILPTMVLKDIMEVPVEECRLDSPARGHFDSEAFLSPGQLTQLEVTVSKPHVWQLTRADER
jgi:hypothetical protein